MPGVNEQRRTPPSRGSASEPQHVVPTPSLRSSADFGFTGTFVSDDMEVTGSLQISPNRVILWASGSQLASWDVTECSVERRSVTKFEVHGGGESLAFTADDPTGLDEAISALAKSRVDTRSRRRLSDVLPASSPVVENATEMVETALTETEAESELPKEQREPPKPKPATAARRSRTGSYQIPRREPEAPVTPPKEPEAPVTPRSEPDAPVSRRPRIKNFQAAQSEAEPSSRTIEAPISRERLVARPAEEEEEEETIADEAIARSTGTRIRAARWLRSDIKEIGIKVAAVALASILLGGFAYSIYVLAGGTGYEPEVFVQDPTTSIPPRPSATAPISSVATVPVPPTTLFETDPAQLTERWNLIAEASRPELVLLRDLTSPTLVAVTPFITLEGVLDPNAGYMTLRSTPTATPQGDGAILSSLGMMVAMSDPSLKPVDRRLLLEALGLDVNDPQLAGIDASLNYNGLTYRLTYFQDQNLLEFAITPEVPTTTTTAAP